MGSIIKLIERETSGKSFNAYRYCFDGFNKTGIDYDDYKEIEWKEYGETIKYKKSIDLTIEALKRRNFPSIFSYFLDGSRHAYKVDDFSFNNNVYPIIAGQVGVGCCVRVDRKLKPAIEFERRFLIAMPDKAFSSDGWNAKDKASILLDNINMDMSNKSKRNIKFDDLLIYDSNRDEKFENKGISKIQNYMVELEKTVVAELVSNGRLGPDDYLIKDGSLEYQKTGRKHLGRTLNLSDEHVKKNYKFVIGVSKSFDPTKNFVKGGGSNSDVIADLKLFERTPAYRFTSSRANVDFCIWYLRIRSADRTKSVFDGIIKIEKIITTEEEKINGIDSDEINNISAHLINERNPVCYGVDERWANHLYPIYLTEMYLKSKYISDEYFIQLF